MRLTCTTTDPARLRDIQRLEGASAEEIAAFLTKGETPKQRTRRPSMRPARSYMLDRGTFVSI